MNAPFVIPDVSVPLKVEGTLVVPLICPACNSHWADMNITFDGPVAPEYISVKDKYKYKARAHLKKGEPIYCPNCGWEYSVWAVYASVMASMNVERIREKYGYGLTKRSDL